MRLPIHDIERLKAAAKKLAALTSHTLTHAQAALAESLGYRNWHELSRQPRASGDTPADSAYSVSLIVHLADRLGILTGDVQYVLAASRLLGPMSLTEQLGIRAAVWRHLIGPPARNKVGSVVRDGAYATRQPAYLCQAGRPTYLLFDSGSGTRGDFEVITPRVPLADFVPARLWVPYGYWLLSDGSEVIYSRDYLPLWRIVAGRVERVEPWLWIENIQRTVNFGSTLGLTSWASGAVRSAAIAHLESRSIRGLPILVDAMEQLMEPGMHRVPAATDRLRLTRRSPAIERPGTHLNPHLR